MMATIRKIKSGYLARQNGELFEQAIMNQARHQRWHVVKIPMGARMIGGFKMVRVQTPFDFIMYKNGKCISLDAKSTKGLRFNASSLTPHQIQNLSQIEDQGFPAGYLVNFSELNVVIFYSAKQLMNMTKRSSLLPIQGVEIGSTMRMDFMKIISYYQSLDEQGMSEEKNSL